MHRFPYLLAFFPVLLFKTFDPSIGDLKIGFRNYVFYEKKTPEDEKKSIPCSFDVSWSHVRNAPQASGEPIYDGYIETSRYKPVIAFSSVHEIMHADKEPHQPRFLSMAGR